MTAPDPDTPLSDAHVLSSNLRGVRRLRGLSSKAVADGMNLSLRTYQDFEAGRGRPNVDYIHRFCRVTDSDPDAFQAAMTIGSPEFAVHCASNKLMRIVMIGAKQLDRRLGDGITHIDARTLVSIVDRVVNELIDGVRDPETTAWMEAGDAALRKARPHPGR